MARNNECMDDMRKAIGRCLSTSLPAEREMPDRLKLLLRELQRSEQSKGTQRDHR